MFVAGHADGLCFRLTVPCPKTAPTRYELSYSMKDQYEVSRDSLEKKELLGSGNFGEVWRGTCLHCQYEVISQVCLACLQDSLHHLVKGLLKRTEMSITSCAKFRGCELESAPFLTNI